MQHFPVYEDSLYMLMSRLPQKETQALTGDQLFQYALSNLIAHFVLEGNEWVDVDAVI